MPTRSGSSSSPCGVPRPRSRTSTSRPSCAVPRADRQDLIEPNRDRPSPIAEALARVHERIARAAEGHDADPASIALVAVSKGVPSERVEEALRAGHDLFGENRVQEVEDKVARFAVARFADVADDTARGRPRWHLVGHLQSNKARRAVAVFEAIQSVDSLDLAARLDRLTAEAGRRLPIYFEVNVDGDPAKSGLRPDDLKRDLEALLGLPALEPLGLMTVGSLAGDAEGARPTFRRLAALSAELSARDGRLGTGLSMGMSDDFEVAIEEGSTCVRIGRAIFGERTTTPMP